MRLKEVAQTQVAQENADIINTEVPSFNTNVIEVEQSIESAQDKLNALASPCVEDQASHKLKEVASAMRAAGLSPLEIANALKEQVGV